MYYFILFSPSHRSAASGTQKQQESALACGSRHRDARRTRSRRLWKLQFRAPKRLRFISDRLFLNRRKKKQKKRRVPTFIEEEAYRAHNDRSKFKKIPHTPILPSPLGYRRASATDEGYPNDLQFTKSPIHTHNTNRRKQNYKSKSKSVSNTLFSHIFRRVRMFYSTEWRLQLIKKKRGSEAGLLFPPFRRVVKHLCLLLLAFLHFCFTVSQIICKGATGARNPRILCTRAIVEEYIPC